jgi:uncharacterized membrane protein YhiD involved in acid resistance
MVIALGLAFALGLFIYLVYRKTFSGIMYSASFGVSLIIMTMITTLVILAVTSNVILSLGMVGALSIVRFRTVIKEPMDIAYLFWAIAGGIVLGAGLMPLAIFGSLFIGLIMVLFAGRKTGEKPFVLVVSMRDETVEAAVMQQLSGAVRKQAVKSKTVSKETIELTMEVRLKEEATGFVNRLSAMEGVNSAVLISYNGEYLA